MTTGTLKPGWNQINQDRVFVLFRGNNPVAYTQDQINQILNPIAQDQNGQPLFLVKITDLSPENMEIFYETPQPSFSPTAYELTYDEFNFIRQNAMQQTATRMAGKQGANSPTMQQTATGLEGISVAGTISGLAGATRLASSSTRNITSGANSFERGVTNLQNADDMSDVSRGITQVSSGLDRFSGLTDKGANAVNANQTEDNRNFFLSAGNWLDKSLFGSIADMMPLDMLKKAIQMVGGCFSGLFKTIGYMVEGDWEKVGSVGLNWLKDAAITGALTYGAYYLGKECNLFGSDDENESSSSSSSSSNSNSSQSVSVSTSSDASLSLKHRPSSDSSTVAILDQAGKIITTGNGHLSSTSAILGNANSSTVFEYTAAQKIDQNTK